MCLIHRKGYLWPSLMLVERYFQLQFIPALPSDVGVGNNQCGVCDCLFTI